MEKDTIIVPNQPKALVNKLNSKNATQIMEVLNVIGESNFDQADDVLQELHDHNIPTILINQCIETLISSKIFNKGATVEKTTYAYLCKSLIAINCIFVTERHLTVIVETSDFLYYLSQIAVRIMSRTLHEYAIRILSAVSESIWTRAYVADAIKRVLAEFEVTLEEWMKEMRFTANGKELHKLNELLYNAELDTCIYCFKQGAHGEMRKKTRERREKWRERERGGEKKREGGRERKERVIIIGMYFPEPPAQHVFTLDDFPFLKVFEEKFDVIREEAYALKNHQDKLIPWPEKFIIEKGWDILGLFAFTNKFDQFCEICPETTKILESIPGLQTALFSCLKPRAHIKPHIGYYTYSEKILRVHLGVIVPDGCKIKINGMDHTWEVGKVLIFDDTFRHEAWNPSFDETRVVLMFDILADVPEEKRSPDFFEKAKKQRELGEQALISNDLLGVISGCLDKSPESVQQRPVNYL